MFRSVNEYNINIYLKLVTSYETYFNWRLAVGKVILT